MGLSKAGAIRAGRAFIEAFMDTSQLDKDIGHVRDKLGRVGKQLTSIGGSLVGFAALRLAPLVAAVKTFADAGDQLHKMSIRTGESVENLSALKFAAGRSGIEFEDLIGSIEELNIRLGEVIRDGTGPAAEALKNLGLDAQELARMSPADRIKAIGQALSEIKSESRRGFLADEIFGGDAFKILPLLREGADGIQRLMDKAKELGLVMSDDAAQDAAQMTDAIEDLKLSFKAVFNTLGRQLLPVVLDFTRWIQDNLPAIREWIGEHKDLIVVLAETLAAAIAVGGGFIAIGAIINGFTTTLGLAQAALKLFNNTSIGSSITVDPKVSQFLNGSRWQRLGRSIGAAFAIGAIIVFATWLYKTNSAVKELNASLEKARELDDEILQRQGNQQQGVLQRASQLQGSEKQDFLSNELELAEKNLEGMNNGVEQQKQLVDELAPTWRSLWQLGKGTFRVEQQDLKAQNEQLKQQKKYVQELRELRAKAQRELEENDGRTAQQMQGIDKILSGLNEQLETFGLDAGQKALRELEKLNANETELAEAREKLAALAQKEAEAEAKKEEEKRRQKELQNAERVSEALHDLMEELRDLDLSPIERAIDDEVDRLAKLGASPEQLALAAQVRRQVELASASGERTFQINDALESGSRAALDAILRSTQGPTSDAARTAAHTAVIAKYQEKLYELERKMMREQKQEKEIVIGRPS